MSLSDTSKLKSLAKKTTAEKEQLGLPTSDYFWASSGSTARNAYNVDFVYGNMNVNYKYNSFNKVLCVGD